MNRPHHAIGLVAAAGIAAAATWSLALPGGADDIRLPPRGMAALGEIPQGAILVFDDNGLLQTVLTDEQTSIIQASDTALHPLAN